MVQTTVISNVRYQHPTIVATRSPVVDEFMKGSVPMNARVLLAAGAASLVEYALLEPNALVVDMVADDDAYRAHLSKSVNLFTNPVSMRGRIRETQKPRKMREHRWRTQVSGLMQRVDDLSVLRSRSPPVIYPSFAMVDPSQYDLALLATEQHPARAIERFHSLGEIIPVSMLYHATNSSDLGGIPLVNASNFSVVRAEPAQNASAVRIEPDVFAQLLGSYAVK